MPIRPQNDCLCVLSQDQIHSLAFDILYPGGTCANNTNKDKHLLTFISGNLFIKNSWGRYENMATIKDLTYVI